MNKIIQRSKETLEKFLENELFETRKVSRKATRKTIDAGITIEYQWTEKRAALGFPNIIFLVVEILKDIGVGLFGAWLYDKLKNKDVKALRIDKTKVEVDEEKIKDIMTEQMKSSE